MVKHYKRFMTLTILFACTILANTAQALTVKNNTGEGISFVIMPKETPDDGGMGDGKLVHVEQNEEKETDDPNCDTHNVQVIIGDNIAEVPARLFPTTQISFSILIVMGGTYQLHMQTEGGENHQVDIAAPENEEEEEEESAG